MIIRDRRVLADGLVIEIVVWQVPVAVPPTTHGLKYRLFYGGAGERILGFDNERGKGDHFHKRGVETPYAYTTLSQLLDDFEAAIIAERGNAI